MLVMFNVYSWFVQVLVSGSSATAWC